MRTLLLASGPACRVATANRLAVRPRPNPGGDASEAAGA
jgi:hypothetical protein